jgi:signal transduction histidine kinase/ligand-binding sensor domain-containing protein
MGRLSFIAFIQCLLVSVALSQDFKYSMRNYSAVDGLPQSQITDLIEDRNGYLWMGTQGGGLARFDGHQFKVYNGYDGLLSNEVIGLHIDTQQNLWALSPTGVSRFDGLGFKSFKMPDDIISTERIRKMYALKDTIFLLSTSGGLSKIYKDSVLYWDKPIARNVSIRTVHTTHSGEVCLFLEDGSIIIQSNKTVFTLQSDLTKIYNVFNKNEDVLIRTEDGLFKLDTKQKKLSKLPWCTRARVLLYDGKRNAFWTTDGNNLFKETIQNNVVKGDTILSEVGMHDVFIDSEENIWLGSNGNGLYKYFIHDFDRVSPDFIKGVMGILAEDDGTLWLGTMAKGLWKIDGKGESKSYFDPNEVWRKGAFTIAKTTDGFIWVGTGYGLGRYDKRTDRFSWFVHEAGLPSYSILAIEADDHGGLWVGTMGGLCYYDGKTFKSFGPESGLEPKTSCWALHYSTKYKTLFIGTDMKFMALTNGKARTVNIPKLSNTVVTSIHSYRDSLLAISTGGVGVLILDPHTSANHFLTSREGLSSDFNYFVSEDEKNYLWIGSEKGIDKVKLNDKYEIEENLHYGYDNGLTGVETNQNAFYFIQDKKYFGLVDGLYEFNDLSKMKRKSFNLHLTDVAILYGEYSAREYSLRQNGFFKIPVWPVLPPDKNHITFYFNRVDKRYPNSVKFKYFLENFDKTWSLPSASDQVTYGNLPPGDYVFRVMATNSSGSWSKAKISYPFTILSPFYQRASFIIGMLILIIGMVTLILYLRVKQRIRKAVQVERIRIKEQEMLRKEIARDFHDEMGNQLTRIINYVSLLKLDGNNGHNHAELYGKVEASAKYLYTGTRDFIWAIDPVNDELSRLFIHIRDFGEKIFEEKNISFRAFNEMKDKIKLPYGFSREANLIFKEAMTNAFKYSDAKNVTWSLRRHNDDGYEMILEDDGRGFCPGDENANGLKNIRERADRINAILRIHSEKKVGTKITLSFKLKTPKYGFTI